MGHVPLAGVHRQGRQGVCHHMPPAGKGLWRSKNCHYLTRKSCFLSPTESLPWSSRVKKRQTYIFILKVSITWHLNKDRCADASWEAYNPLLLRRLSRRAADNSWSDNLVPCCYRVWGVSHFVAALHSLIFSQGDSGAASLRIRPELRWVSFSESLMQGLFALTCFRCC